MPKTMIEILKQPIDLTKEELSNIFQSVIEFNFDKGMIDDFDVKKSNYSPIKLVIISCHWTGYSLTITGEYNVEVSSSLNGFKKLNTIKLFNCLLEIGAVKLN